MKANTVWLISLFGILEPVTFALGVKRGKTIRCNSCSKFKFVWASTCPHCHDNKNKQAIPQKRWWSKDGSQIEASSRAWHRAYRYGIPIMLVVFCGLGLTSRGWFERNTIKLGILEGYEEVSTTEAFNEIQSYIKSQQNVEEWLNERREKAIDFPEHYRIDVSIAMGELNKSRIIIKSFGVPWDSANHLGKFISDQIIREFKNKYPIKVMHGNRKTSMSVPIGNIITSRTFLDNEMHLGNY